jgi:hypothetical protein
MLEAEFEALLRTAQPAPALFGVARKMFTDLWNHRIASGGQRVRTLKAEQQIAKLLDRIVETETPSVVRSYENRIHKLEDHKILLGEQIEKCGRPVRDLEGMCRTALDFLGNPWKLWVSDQLEDKRLVLKLVFADRLAYIRNSGFRTAALSLSFKVLSDFPSVE